VPDESERSYRALAAVPHLMRMVLGMVAARFAEHMTALALVLFTLQRFEDAALTGLVTFVAILPGLLVSPLAGALLDRHGRTPLIVLDLVIAAASLWLVAILTMVDALPAWLLVTIVGVNSLTGPLSRTGFRSLFPVIVPAHLWERANAIDSNSHLLASVAGPPLAGALLELASAPVALGAIGTMFAVAAITLRRVPEPHMEIASSGRLVRDAWDGLVYTVRNRTLLGLGISMSMLNVACGIIVIVVPLLVLERFNGSDTTVGLLFAAQGAAGGVAALSFGRMKTAGRERGMLALSALLFAMTLGLLAIPSLVAVAVALALLGFLDGPMDVALFTLRQRRTSTAWIGRAFAVSMSVNFLGYPIGSMIAGALGPRHIETSVVVAIVAAVAAAVLTWLLLPRSGTAEAR